MLDTGTATDQNFSPSFFRVETRLAASPSDTGSLDQELLLPDKKIRFDEFEVDYSRFQLYRAGNPVRLEGLPLQLLMFLVEKRGQLVTREDISAALWSKDVFVDVEQGINTAVRKIRRALGDEAAEPRYLQTVVGRGYRFVAPNAQEISNAQGAAESFAVSPEELGRAIMTAAGLDPDNPRGDLKASGEVRKLP
jgi:DNA-binding winged helix-turn-helix (wHTH) protein